MAALSSPAALRVLTKKSLIGLSFCSCWYVPHSALKDFHAAAMDRDIVNTPGIGRKQEPSPPRAGELPRLGVAKERYFLRETP
jgi:hypothetical protein